MKSRGFVVAFALLPFALFARADAGTTRTWRADTGVLPDAHCYWTQQSSGSSSAALNGGELEITSATPGDALIYRQSGADLALPDPWVIEARVRFGNSNNPGGTATTSTAIAFATSADHENLFFIDADKIYLWSTPFVMGDSYAMDTHGSHTYRIEISGSTTVKVFVDGTLRLNGAILTDPFFEDTPRLWWGDGTEDASGTSYWVYVTHNGNAQKTCTLFSDDLSGPAGDEVIGTTPEVNGAPWVGAGLQSFGEFHFVAGGGVEDAGPNSYNSNAMVRSPLLAPFPLSELATGEVLHVRGTVGNSAADPHLNILASSRIDFVLSTGNHVAIGEFDTGGAWGASSYEGDPISTGLGTYYPGPYTFDLYLDPNDVFGDGSAYNAMLGFANSNCPLRGFIRGLTPATKVTEVWLVRNVDNEVFFQDVRLISEPGYQAEGLPKFRSNLDGPEGTNLVGTFPELSTGPWTGIGLQPINELLFSAGGGVEDAGPNSRFSNSGAVCALSPFSLGSLEPGMLLHFRVTMLNISATPADNLFESTRAELHTDTSGEIALGEYDTARTWGAGSTSGVSFASGVTTGQSGAFVLDLYLDPNDYFSDGPAFNAAMAVNGGNLVRGKIDALDAATTISAVRLIRNVDDEVRFDDVLLEAICASTNVLAVGDHPVPGDLGHLRAIPNPFAASAGLELSLPGATDMSVVVYDIAGRVVRVLHSGRMESGVQRLRWDGMDSRGTRANAGVYFVTARSSAGVLSTRLVRIQ